MALPMPGLLSAAASVRRGVSLLESFDPMQNLIRHRGLQAELLSEPFGDETP